MTHIFCTIDVINNGGGAMSINNTLVVGGGSSEPWNLATSNEISFSRMNEASFNVDYEPSEWIVVLNTRSAWYYGGPGGSMVLFITKLNGELNLWGLRSPSRLQRLSAPTVTYANNILTINTSSIAGFPPSTNGYILIYI